MEGIWYICDDSVDVVGPVSPDISRRIDSPASRGGPEVADVKSTDTGLERQSGADIDARGNPGVTPMRKGEVSRTTAETALSVRLDLDGSGLHDNQTGVGFFDHMLDQLARHALIDLETRATGDLHIDDHHTVEDIGIAIGRALAQALGDKRGVRRYGSCLLPMDETLVRAALDLSGRPFLVWNVAFPSQKIGGFDTELVREFFTAFAMNGGVTLNVALIDGANSHHIAEAVFKAVAQALRAAVEPEPRMREAIPSTKGTLSG